MIKQLSPHRLVWAYSDKGNFPAVFFTGAWFYFSIDQTLFYFYSIISLLFPFLDFYASSVEQMLKSSYRALKWFTKLWRALTLIWTFMMIFTPKMHSLLTCSPCLDLDLVHYTGDDYNKKELLSLANWGDDNLECNHRFLIIGLVSPEII